MKPTTAFATVLAIMSAWLLNGSSSCEGSSEMVTAASVPVDPWRRIEDTVLRAGIPHWDGRVQTAIADPDLYFDAAQGRLHLYYQTGLAWFYTDSNPRIIIKHGVSEDDGETWILDAGAALAPSNIPQAWDSRWVETPSVIYDPSAPADRRYKMYYSGARDQHPLGFPRYSIGLAISSDGVTFRRLPSSESPYNQAGAVLRVREALPDVAGFHDGTVADPEVKRIGDVYHLWFSSFANDSQNRTLAFGISHATSTDGIHWVASPNNPVPTLRDGSNGAGQQPSVEWNPKTRLFEMWFTSDTNQERSRIPSTFNPAYGFWRATSPDAYHWKIDYNEPRDFHWTPDAPNEAYGLLTGADAVVIGDYRQIFYTGWSYTDVPDWFFVPTAEGPEPAVLKLLRAVRHIDK